MIWIKYQIVQSVVSGQPVLVNKKVGYDEANLAIAQTEAYNGYELIEDDTPAPQIEKIPTKVSELENDSGFVTETHNHPASSITAGTLAGQVKAKNDTNYTTQQVRNIVFVAKGASTPTTSNGDVVLVYT